MCLNHGIVGAGALTFVLFLNVYENRELTYLFSIFKASQTLQLYLVFPIFQALHL